MVTRLKAWWRKLKISCQNRWVTKHIVVSRPRHGASRDSNLLGAMSSFTWWECVRACVCETRQELACLTHTSQHTSKRHVVGHSFIPTHHILKLGQDRFGVTFWCSRYPFSITFRCEGPFVVLNRKQLASICWCDTGNFIVIIKWYIG